MYLIRLYLGMDINEILTKTLISSMSVNAKMDALAATLLKDDQQSEYNKTLKEFWRSDLLEFHGQNPGLFSDDALDVLISLFD